MVTIMAGMLHVAHHWFFSHPRNGHRPHLLRAEGWLVSLAVFLGITWFAVQTPFFQGQVMGQNTDITIETVLSRINTARETERLTPLALNTQLTQAANAKANHMMQHDYWSHTAPDGSTPWAFIRGAGYQYSTAGENLARSFTDTNSMITAWLASPSHRRNVLHSEYQETGIAVREGRMNGRETILVVQMFGRPLGGSAQNTDSTAVALAPAPAPSTLPTTAPIAPAAVLAAESTLPISSFRAVQLGAVSLLVFLALVLSADMVLTDAKHRARHGKNFAHLIVITVIAVTALLARTGQLGGAL